MHCINSAWIKGISVGLALVMILLVPVSCASTPTELEEEASAVAPESWQVGEHWRYSPQAIWGDTFVAGEYIYDSGLEGQYITTYNLQTREKRRLKEIPLDYRFEEPSIYEDKVVWSSFYYSEEFRMSREKDFDTLNWDVFLLDLKTGEVRQITTDEHAQIRPRIYGDTIVWLDNRHVEDYHNPNVFDIYAYDLRTGQETRLTSSTSVEGRFLNINGNLVVWSDNRHANPEKTIHAENEPNHNNEIYAFDLAAKKEQRITDYDGNDHYPAIDGSRVVWLRQFGLREAEVFLYDLGNGKETQVSHGRYADYSPSISGDRIAWADARISQGNTAGDVVMNDVSGAAEIYLYGLESKQEMLLVPSERTGGGQGRKITFRQVWFNPVIYGNFVVYTLERQIGSIVYATRLDDK